MTPFPLPNIKLTASAAAMLALLLKLFATKHISISFAEARIFTLSHFATSAHSYLR